MWKVAKEKIRNVKVGQITKIFYANDTLPADYKPSKSYIDQGFVVWDEPKKNETIKISKEK